MNKLLQVLARCFKSVKTILEKARHKEEITEFFRKYNKNER